VPPAADPRRSFLERHGRAIAAAVLALAAFNLTFRLGREVVTEWDESLYAISAWEMVTSGHWIATTFGGALDYYNTKPPLNVWLIALSFKAFGVSLLSLRITSVLAAWLTVLTLQIWLRRAVGTAVALFSSLVLATCFQFLYGHAGRSANTDAPFTLTVTLTVVTLWAGQARPWRRVWLGPILAAAFLLKGMAVLMPLAIVASFEGWCRAQRPQPRSWAPLVAAAALGTAPAAAWMWARWQIDQWRFLERLFGYDFVQGTVGALEGHAGVPWFYLGVLQRNEYGWLAVGAVAWLICPIAWPRLRAALWFWQGGNGRRMLLGSWAAATFLIPTVMRTKLPWYLNPFYPVLAVGIGWLIARAVSSFDRRGRWRWRYWAVVCSVAVALAAAEGRLIWYSFHNRDLSLSAQSVLLRARHHLTGRQVFRETWEHGDVFVAQAFGRARPREISSLEDFLRDSRPGDYFLASTAVAQPNLVLDDSDGRHWLYHRTDVRRPAGAGIGTTDGPVPR
jgi:4-amino-4-deoxy-L-arabinose transferase-like glycosyltransferase